uniref:Pyruvate carboxyltransferase domain-containing protein n=1 Tax=viral metagenome TaxID=1070528 RepID=A0A6C0HI10_9ZZZZ
MHACSSYVRGLFSHSFKHQEIFSKISPILFDVSLRDGLQGANVSDWPTSKKRETFDIIHSKYRPQSIEIGSLCSYKLLPIMADTRELHTYAVSSFKRENADTMPYVLIPSISKLLPAIHAGMKHLSFITSVSNVFQLKNTNMTLQQAKSQFSQIFEMLDGEPDRESYVKKLYISCINECPISGKIDNDFVISEILSYNTQFSFDELCLSDTCGTLLYDDFAYITETIHVFGVPLSKISLHLHVSSTNLDNLENILRHCFRKGIRKFDVSFIETGGCSITMNRDKLLANMTYEQFYHILSKHIDAVVENNSL